MTRKRVVDEVSGWLRVFDDGTVDRTWIGPSEALFLMNPVQPFDTPCDGVTLHDIPGHPSLRLYLPESSCKPLPILLHFHGGGFCISHFSWFMYHQFYSRLAAAVPAAVVSVELPLAPEHGMPSAVDACFAALLRLRRLARRPDGSDPAERLLRGAADFSRVFLIGDSSGGNLVHLVAAWAGEEDSGFWSPLRLAGGIPLQPGFVRSTRSRSELELQADSVFFTLDMLDKLLALGLPQGATKDHPFTCPMGDAAPPLEKYCEAMKEAGKEVEVLVSGGVSHSFYLNKFTIDNDPTTAKRTEELIVAIKDFVGRH
ncbi:hypothetical protein B296_00005281 [Ensete ventricosum]|uniref:Alpha/beta hydrolase fold-3 domain-containing protein n=1 Tax=Ensete ventricosum TaxID=4639 RepID=A0A427ANG1_ENSVE|nr:hypothetical protein B296_00005281 [Ensete ventricosum]